MLHLARPEGSRYSPGKAPVGSVGDDPRGSAVVVDVVDVVELILKLSH